MFKLHATLQRKTMGSSLVIRHLPRNELGKPVYIKEDCASCILVATIKVGIQVVLQCSPTSWDSYVPKFYFHAWVNFEINFTHI
jgi:hypothetical protein